MDCRICEMCKKGAGRERSSIIQEKEQNVISKSVELDLEEKKASAFLAFKLDPKENLASNRPSSLKRMFNVLSKYEKEPETLKSIIAAFAKLRDNGHMAFLKDLSPEQQQMLLDAEVAYYLPWDISFKQESKSTPARPCFDASATTASGNSLNDLLAIGDPDLAVLAQMLLEFTMGPTAMVSDIGQFYPSVHLKEKHWTFQRVLLTEDLKTDGEVLEAIIMKLIFGVCCSGGQCEEVLRRLSEEAEGITKEVADMLLRHRYVDDFMKSVLNKQEAERLVREVNEALA